MSQLSRIQRKLYLYGLTPAQRREIMSDLSRFTSAPKPAAYRPRNGRGEVVLLSDFGVTVRVTTEFCELWPDTKWVDIHFTPDLPPGRATVTTWRQRGYAIRDGEKPVSHVGRNPLGYKKTTITAAVFSFSQCRELRGTKAAERRRAYLKALEIIPRLSLPDPLNSNKEASE
jgi:hypothetical protein